jgi:hypothetical protein
MREGGAPDPPAHARERTLKRCTHSPRQRHLPSLAARTTDCDLRITPCEHAADARTCTMVPLSGADQSVRGQDRPHAPEISVWPVVPTRTEGAEEWTREVTPLCVYPGHRTASSLLKRGRPYFFHISSPAWWPQVPHTESPSAGGRAAGLHSGPRQAAFVRQRSRSRVPRKTQYRYQVL